MTTVAARTESSSALPSIAMAGVIIAWGLGPPVSKLITAPPIVAVFARMWLSVPVLYAVAIGHNGHRPTWQSLRRAAPAGALFGINLCFVFATFHHASIAVLSVMAALQPGLVLLVAGRVLGERPTRWHIAWTAVGILGTTIVILGAGSAVHTTWLGVLFATLALLTFTGFFVATKMARMNHQVDAVSWIADLTLISAITVTPLAILGSGRGHFAQIGGSDWLWLAFIVIVTGIVGHSLMSWVHGFIDASRSSLYVLAMNVVAVGGAWLIHDEPLTVVQLLGGLVVLGAVAAVVSRPPVRIAPSLAPAAAVPVPAAPPSSRAGAGPGRGGRHRLDGSDRGPLRLSSVITELAPVLPVHSHDAPTGDPHPMREITRQVAFEGGWSPERRAWVAELFDGVTPVWDADHNQPGRYDALDDALARGDLGTGRCVELGAGTGLATRRLSGRFSSLTAVDLSPAMIGQIRPDMAARVVADSAALPVPTAVVDVLVLVNMLLFPDEVDRVLATVGRLVWINTMAELTPIHLTPSEVESALPGRWDGVTSRAGSGLWAVVRRA